MSNDNFDTLGKGYFDTLVGLFPDVCIRVDAPFLDAHKGKFRLWFGSERIYFKPEEFDDVISKLIKRSVGIA